MIRCYLQLQVSRVFESSVILTCLRAQHQRKGQSQLASGVAQLKLALFI